jgi:hypothetical protein
VSWARDVTTWICDGAGTDELDAPTVCKRVAGDGAGGEPEGEESLPPPFDSERSKGSISASVMGFSKNNIELLCVGARDGATDGHDGGPGSIRELEGPATG